MGSWWLLFLLSSQLVGQHSVVHATFDISLQWLRGDTSLFSDVVNTSATTAETATRHTLQDFGNAITEDHLYGRPTDLVRDIPGVTATESTTQQTIVTTTTEAVDLRETSTEHPWTDTETADWTTQASTEEVTASTVPWMVNATQVSLDELALEIGKVPDPVLHVVDNDDGSSSFVVVSGRLGDNATTTTVAATTTVATEPTTTAVPFTTTTIPSTTASTVPNVTSPYQILLDYLRPFIFGRFSADTTTSSSPSTTEATTVPTTPATTTVLPTTATPAQTLVPIPTFVDPRQSLSDVTTVTAVPDDSNRTESTTAVISSATTTEKNSTTTQFPAEFRGTVDHLPISAITDIAGLSDNATVLPTTLQPTAFLPESTWNATIYATTTHAPTSHVTVPWNDSAPRVSTANPTDVAVRTPVIIRAITTRHPMTTPPSVPPLTEPPNSSFPAIFDLFGDSSDPASQTPASGDSTPTTAAEEPVYRHFYDPSQLMQTF